MTFSSLAPLIVTTIPLLGGSDLARLELLAPDADCASVRDVMMYARENDVMLYDAPNGRSCLRLSKGSPLLLIDASVPNWKRVAVAGWLDNLRGVDLQADVFSLPAERTLWSSPKGAACDCAVPWIKNAVTIGPCDARWLRVTSDRMYLAVVGWVRTATVCTAAQRPAVMPDEWRAITFAVEPESAGTFARGTLGNSSGHARAISQFTLEALGCNGTLLANARFAIITSAPGATHSFEAHLAADPADIASYRILCCQAIAGLYR